VRKSTDFVATQYPYIKLLLILFFLHIYFRVVEKIILADFLQYECLHFHLQKKEKRLEFSGPFYLPLLLSAYFFLIANYAITC
jgi:hypothetical protein